MRIGPNGFRPKKFAQGSETDLRRRKNSLVVREERGKYTSGSEKPGHLQISEDQSPLQKLKTDALFTVEWLAAFTDL